MKTKTKIPSWLTTEMSAKGLTPTIVHYLFGETKSISKSIVWPEFFLVWFIQKEKFESTKIFKETMKPFINMKDGLKGRKQMNVVLNAINQVPEAKDFFLGRISIIYAVELCKSFWDFSQVWDRTLVKSEKQLVLNKVRESLALLNLDYYDLKRYYDMTVDFPHDRVVVDALIGCFIKKDTRSSRYLSQLIPFTENQIRAFCNQVRLEKYENISPMDLFNMYSQIRNDQLMYLLFEQLEGKNKYYLLHIFDEVKSLIRNCKTKKVEELKQFLFPITHFILSKMDIRNDLHANCDDILNILPCFRQDDEKIEQIISYIVSYYGNYEYKLLHESFLRWYKYAPREVFIDLFKQSIPLHGYNVFVGARQVFELCKDELVIDAVIDIQLPLLEEVNDDFAGFMDWLKTGDTLWYPRIKQTILEAGYVSKWFEKIRITDERRMGYFLRVVQHFD